MTSDQLALFFVRKPFQPLTLYLADGRSILVQHQDFSSVSKAGLGVWVYHDNGEMEIIDAALICSIRTAGAVDMDQFI
jgi:hypothetical protein